MNFEDKCNLLKMAFTNPMRAAGPIHDAVQAAASKASSNVAEDAVEQATKKTVPGTEAAGRPFLGTTKMQDLGLLAGLGTIGGIGAGLGTAVAVPYFGGQMLGQVEEDTGVTPGMVAGLAGLGAFGVYRGRKNRLAEERLLKALENFKPAAPKGWW